jgi:hypothetical protein
MIAVMLRIKVAWWRGVLVQVSRTGMVNKYRYTVQ